MTFFKIVFMTLGFVMIFNLIQTAVAFQLQPQVYACKEITITDPVNVQRKCGRKIK